MTERRLKSSASVRLAKATLADPKSTAHQKKYAKIVLKGGKSLMLTADRGTKIGSDTIFKMDKRELHKPKPKPKVKTKAKTKAKAKAKVDLTPGKVRPSRKSKAKLIIKPAKKKAVAKRVKAKAVRKRLLRKRNKG